MENHGGNYLKVTGAGYQVPSNCRYLELNMQQYDDGTQGKGFGMVATKLTIVLVYPS